MRRLLDGVGDNGFLDVLFDAVLGIGFAPGFVEQSFDAG
jgi:hypothetical protein